MQRHLSRTFSDTVFNFLQNICHFVLKNQLFLKLTKGLIKKRGGKNWYVSRILCGRIITHKTSTYIGTTATFFGERGEG